MSMVGGGKTAQEKACVGVPLLLFPQHPLRAEVGEQAAPGERGPYAAGTFSSSAEAFPVGFDLHL